MPRKHKRRSLTSRPKIRVYKTTARHRCGWPHCNTNVGPSSWGCRKHTQALPMDLRGKIAGAWGPPQQSYLKAVLQKFMTWYKQQQPSNYEPGVFLPAPKGSSPDPNLDS